MLLRLSLLCWLATVVAIRTLDTSTQKLFGHSIKNGQLVANKEITLFEHNCTTPPCAITHIHCPAAGPQGWETALLKVYVDGDTAAPITITLPELSHVGKWNQDGNERGDTPWGGR